MVMVEGVATSLNPAINMWDVAAPYVGEWIRGELGPEAAIADVETAMKGDDKAQIESRSKALEEAGQSLYAAAAAAEQGGGAAPGAGASGGAAHDDVVDAEFTEVKDDTK